MSDFVIAIGFCVLVMEFYQGFPRNRKDMLVATSDKV